MSDVRIYWQIGICTLLHMLVDGLCVCSLYLLASSLPLPTLTAVFISYNTLAFLTQPLTGIYADRMEHKHWMLLFSVVLLTLAVASTILTVSAGLPAFGAVSVPALLGLGNSLFHVWGGKQVAVKTGNDMRALGLFVSTGAFGLAIGYVFFSFTFLSIITLLISLLAVTYLHLESPSHVRAENTVTEKRLGMMLTAICLILLMTFVMFRSFVGESFSSYMPKDDTWILVGGLVAMLGKMAGGWIAHHTGIIRAMALALTIVAVCHVFRDAGTASLLTGLFAMNCTMAVTLYLANILLPGKEGLAFGLLAAALMPGYLLASL
jgi:MFS family permease